MFREKKFRKAGAAFFAVLYLFVALFSQNFHNHDSGSVFKDFNFKKSERTITTGHSVDNSADCISCHFLHTGNSLVPQDYQFSFFSKTDFQNAIFAYEQRFANCDHLFIQLRGPPANFI